MRDRFPPIEPYETGMLDVGGGHALYWECSGNPAGRPAVYLHGGPGGGMAGGYRRYFNPAQWRIIGQEQRGCGRSRPLASDLDADLRSNTTPQLVADLERLREHLGVDRWTVLGVSWGTTLGLAYAQAHTARVDAVVLALVTTTSRREVRWITEEVGCLFPEAWAAFAAAVPASLRDRPLVEAYATLLCDPDPAVHVPAARAWCAWEDAHVSLSPGHVPNPRYEDPSFRLQFARLVTHYWSNAAFLEDEQLIRDAANLNGIPGVLIHGRYDVSSPLETAWRLSKAWTTSRLVVLEDTGHGDAVRFPLAVDAAVDELAVRG